MKSSTCRRVNARWRVGEGMESNPHFKPRTECTGITKPFNYYDCCPAALKLFWSLMFQSLFKAKKGLNCFAVFVFLCTVAPVCENGWRCCLINRDRKTPTDYIRNGVLYVTEK